MNDKDLEKLTKLAFEQVVEDLENGMLDAKERAKILLALLPYKFPKLQQIENKGQAIQVNIFGDVGD